MLSLNQRPPRILMTLTFGIIVPISINAGEKHISVASHGVYVRIPYALYPEYQATKTFMKFFINNRNEHENKKRILNN